MKNSRLLFLCTWSDPPPDFSTPLYDTLFVRQGNIKHRTIQQPRSQNKTKQTNLNNAISSTALSGLARHTRG
jgi:hypothetical protein